MNAEASTRGKRNKVEETFYDDTFGDIYLHQEQVLTPTSLYQ
jgi:hypothetical protein